MTALLLVLTAVAAIFAAFYVVTGIELDRRTTERDAERAKRETAEAVLYAILAERRLQASGTVVPLRTRGVVR